MRRSEVRRRQNWMAEYETALIILVPAMSGHVCWDTALTLYLKGYSPTDAAQCTAARVTEGVM